MQRLSWMGVLLTLVGCVGNKPDTQNGTDQDGDGYLSTNGDCDDSNATIHPDAAEIWYDGIDQDCDGGSDFDQDGDGAEANAEDCNDEDAAINPSATEICDGIDQNCDGTADEGLGGGIYYQDADGDSFGDPATEIQTCQAPEGYVGDGRDCNDADARINPDANESCADTEDLNCDGAIGGEDGDGDGVSICSDCDDSNNTVYDGAPEICDNLDNNCNGLVDDEAVDQRNFYLDNDGDGYGDPSQSISGCVDVPGYVFETGDCDDNNTAVSPGTPEICDGMDNDCSGGIDDGAVDIRAWYMDADGDGDGDLSSPAQLACDQPASSALTNTDCDDGNAAIYGGAFEICDGYDNDCNGGTDDVSIPPVWYMDMDGDTYGDNNMSQSGCTQPAGYVMDGGDCDDSDPSINPAAYEVCDGLDNDCDNTTDIGARDALTFYMDADSDTYGDPGTSVESCSQPAGYVTIQMDCDDNDSAINPLATEVCDGLDNDCDGTIDIGASDVSTFYADTDRDGYGNANNSMDACTQPSGYVSDATDCNDATATAHPGATETCDAADIDEDCDGLADDLDTTATGKVVYYADVDGDTYGDASHANSYCDQPSGGVLDNTDCDDTVASTYPNATEADNGVDDDCDSYVDEDFLNVGDVIITEVTRQPYVNGNATNADAVWFEVHNTTARSIDMSNWYVGRVSSSIAIKGIYVDPSTPVILSAGGYAVFCKTNNYETPQSGMGTIPYPLNCDYVWGETTDTYHATTLNPQRDEDDLFIYVEGNNSTGWLMDDVHWYYDATNGYWPRQAQASLTLDPAHLNGTDNDSISYWCFTTQSSNGTFAKTGTYRWWDNTASTTDEYGTPAAANFDCPNIN